MIVCAGPLCGGGLLILGCDTGRRTRSFLCGTSSIDGGGDTSTFGGGEFRFRAGRVPSRLLRAGDLLRRHGVSESRDLELDLERERLILGTSRNIGDCRGMIG